MEMAPPPNEEENEMVSNCLNTLTGFEEYKVTNHELLMLFFTPVYVFSEPKKPSWIIPEAGYRTPRVYSPCATFIAQYTHIYSVRLLGHRHATNRYVRLRCTSHLQHKRHERALTTALFTFTSLIVKLLVADMLELSIKSILTNKNTAILPFCT